MSIVAHSWRDCSTEWALARARAGLEAPLDPGRSTTSASKHAIKRMVVPMR
jgi:hypothetical protein